MSYDLLTLSDLSAGLVGTAFSYTVYGSNKPYMQGVQSFIISMIARLASQPKFSFLGNLDNSQKNQLIISILNGIAGYSRGSGIAKNMIAGSAIDLLGQEILNLIHQQDTGFIDLSNMTADGDIPRRNRGYNGSSTS